MQLEKTLPLTVFWCAWRSSFATTNVSPFRMNFMASLSFGRSASTLESCSQKSQAGGTATALAPAGARCEAEEWRKVEGLPDYYPKQVS
jgi:hypothetical protein